MNNYTYEEQKKIVRYIIDNKIVGNLQGNALWKQMEKEKVLDRSWQSMRSHFKTKIIDMLHLYNISEYNRRMILHGFGRRTKANIGHPARSVAQKKPLPFSSDSDSDTTLCETVPRKRARRNSGSSSSLDLLAGKTNSDIRHSNVSTAVANIQPSTSTSTPKTNCDIRGFMVNTAIVGNQPSTSTTSAKDNSKDQEIRQQKQNDIIVISDSDDEQRNEPIKSEIAEPIVNNIENEPFSMEEDTQLILFFKSHTTYLSDIQNKFAYVAFQYDTPTSLRSPEQLKDRFVEHIMPKLYTYNCLTYEEMITYYDRADVDIPLEFLQLISESVAEQKKNKELAAKELAIAAASTDVPAQAQQQLDNLSDTDVPMADVEIVNDEMLHIVVPDHDGQDQAQVQQNIHDVAAVDSGKKLTVVDAATQTRQKHGVDKMCGTDGADASLQEEPSMDKLSDTDVLMQDVEWINDDMLYVFVPEHDVQDQQTIHDACNVSEKTTAQKAITVDAATQTQRQHGVDKMCGTEVPVKHIEYERDGILHIFVPEHDDHGQPQDRKKIYKRFNVPEKNVHFIHQMEYNILNVKRHTDGTARTSIREFLIDNGEMVCMIIAVQRLRQTLRNVRGQDASVDSVKNKNGCNLVLKNDSETSVSTLSNTIVPCTPESVSDSETTSANCVTVPDNLHTRATQTFSESELIFHIFQRALGKGDVSTQIDASQSDNHDQMDSTQDGGHDQNGSLISIQPNVEFNVQQFCRPMQVAQASGESDVREVPKDSSGSQIEPLDLSAQSFDADCIELVLSSNSETFYTAVSQNSTQH